LKISFKPNLENDLLHFGIDPGYFVQAYLVYLFRRKIQGSIIIKAILIIFPSLGNFRNSYTRAGFWKIFGLKEFLYPAELWNHVGCDRNFGCLKHRISLGLG